MSVRSELQKLAPDVIVELYDLDLTDFGGDLLHFHAGLNELYEPVVWRGNTYAPWPMSVKGFQVSGQGRQGRPKVTVANITGLITGLVSDFDDLVGAVFTRRRTFRKYLDAVNFPDGTNSDADPEAHISIEKFIVERKIAEDDLRVEFELASPLDLPNVMIPARVIVNNICPSLYRGGECGYAGPPVADSQDQAVTELSQDVCGKRLSSCRLRFGANNQLPFGGFPATNIIARV